MVALLELITVVGILLLEMVSLIDQITTNNLQRKYWFERSQYYKRRALHPPKTAKATVTQPVAEIKNEL